MEELKIERADLGPLLHLALRKSCDSKPTSLIWNYISMRSTVDAWAAYLDAVWNNLESNSMTTVVALRRATQELPYKNAEFSVMRLGFELFSDDDWECLASGLLYYAKL